MDLSSHCKEQDIEICAIKLAHSSLNVYVLSLYRSLTRNFDTFIEKLEILNLLFLNPVNLIICGDFNVNFMIDNTKKYQIISLLKMYNLDYIVNFSDRLCGLVVRVSGYRYRGPGFDPRRYQIF